MPPVRNEYEINGVVQGVGFRPALLRLAREAGLGGWVQNRSGGVRLALEGAPAAVDAFIGELPGRLPPAARLSEVRLVASHRTGIEANGNFRIFKSEQDRERRVLIPADLAVCADCAREVLTPGGRRHAYPFTTCTACGPRYTVVNAMPYDRERTTLADFPLCRDCEREYCDPHDRRFHAESIACPACGPRAWLENANGTIIASGQALPAARRALAAGAILAVRGIGGFLLAVDAMNREAVARLRERKRRPHKPLAVMAPDLRAVEKFCLLSASARALLTGPAAPIVILPARGDTGGAPLDLLSPDTRELGLMLPTSPLHLLLLEPLAGDPVPRYELLVMTSGNRRGEPICISNAEARARLAGIADFFLMHDREINLRNDDSLVAFQGEQAQVWRRARGFAPHPLRLHRGLKAACLGLGAMLKNTVALAHGREVVLSPHVGDLDTPEAVSGQEQAISCLLEFLGREPERVAVDLHPDLASTRLGSALARRRGLPLVRVQHHHAHAVAGLAEHGRDRCLALVFDGTGLGTDGNIWGAELLDASWTGFARLATFRPAPLPGGDAAVRDPARQVLGRLHALGLARPRDLAARLRRPREHLELWARQCDTGLNAPLSHAAGRVFDAWSALLGLQAGEVSYEAQAAIRLEALAAAHGGGRTPRLDLNSGERDGLLEVDWAPAFAGLLRGLEQGDRKWAAADWALALHALMAEAGTRMVAYAMERSPCREVLLTGGVFMNRILTRMLSRRLRELGVRVLLPGDFPPNDGAVSLGQTVVGGSCLRPGSE